MRSSLFKVLPFILAPGLALAQTAQCSDGSVSYSADFQGTCSHHGGVEVWLDKEMEEQTNDWCDENPDCALIRIGEVLEVTETTPMTTAVSSNRVSGSMRVTVVFPWIVVS